MITRAQVHYRAVNPSVNPSGQPERSGGSCHDEPVAVRFPESTKISVRQRLAARARDEPGRCDHHVHARHDGLPARPRHRSRRDAELGCAHGQHHASAHRRRTGVEALTDAGSLPLCRLRYVGSAHDWQVAIYRASHDDYQESIFPNGLPFGPCQDALDLACGLYLNDPTQPGRTSDPRRTNERDH